MDCNNKLWIGWTANTEPNLYGYTIYYGLSGQKTVLVSQLSNKTMPKCYLFASDLLITRNADATAGKYNQYDICIDAFDSSGIPQHKIRYSQRKPKRRYPV